MIKEVKKYIDDQFKDRSHIVFPDKVRNIKCLKMKNIKVAYFDFDYIDQTIIKKKGFYCLPNSDTESGFYFNKQNYKKMFNKFAKELKTEYKFKKIKNFKKANLQNIKNKLHFYELLDAKFDLEWKKIKENKRIDNISIDFI